MSIEPGKIYTAKDFLNVAVHRLVQKRVKTGTFSNNFQVVTDTFLLDDSGTLVLAIHHERYTQSMHGIKSNWFSSIESLKCLICLSKYKIN